MKKLPIGIETFAKIRDKENNYIYIDKTKIALNLIKSSDYYFLSRPRRFGKSLFLDTLQDIFEAKKDLFKDLYIHDKYDWSIKYPVIKISFTSGVIFDRDDLKKRILNILKKNQKDLKINCEEIKDVREYFNQLIELAYEKYNQKVVILVDEYDKPILDNIENTKIAKELREELKNIYSVIKGNDKYIKFVFLTGVSKFSKVSLFSGLNNLEDITLDENYSDICGYTQSDLEREFKEHLKGVDLNEVKLWYNGYNWLGESVYNPFDILLFISKNKSFKNYWFETGSPSFLIKLLQNKNYYIPNIEKIKISEKIIDSFDVNNIAFETILFQTGYLTIKDVKKVGNILQYYLTYPNLEVKYSLTDTILSYLTNTPIKNEDNKYNLDEVLVKNDLDKFRDVFYVFFASIPNDWYRKNNIANYEGYYASIFYCYFTALGLDLIVEDSTNLGRIDLTLKFKNRVYIMEFKVIEFNKNKNSALKQIKDKKYYEKYLNFKEIYLIGIEFSKDKKNITSYEWERM